MAEETFRKALELSKSVGPRIAAVSGGEPTEHPDIIRFLEIAEETGVPTLLLSNGMFLADKDFADDIIRKTRAVQITNDPRYYPQPLPEEAEEYRNEINVAFEDTIRLISPTGRAKDGAFPTQQRQSPHCFNIRSMTMNTHSLNLAMLALLNHGYFCCPSVNIDGTVVAGELPICYPLGTVDDDDLALSTKMRTMACNKCGLYDGIDQELRLAVGESRIIL